MWSNIQNGAAHLWRQLTQTSFGSLHQEVTSAWQSAPVLTAGAVLIIALVGFFFLVSFVGWRRNKKRVRKANETVGTREAELEEVSTEARETLASLTDARAKLTQAEQRERALKEQSAAEAERSRARIVDLEGQLTAAKEQYERDLATARDNHAEALRKRDEDHARVLREQNEEHTRHLKTVLNTVSDKAHAPTPAPAPSPVPALAPAAPPAPVTLPVFVSAPAETPRPAVSEREERRRQQADVDVSAISIGLDDLAERATQLIELVAVDASEFTPQLGVQVAAAASDLGGRVESIRSLLPANALA